MKELIKYVVAFFALTAQITIYSLASLALTAPVFIWLSESDMSDKKVYLISAVIMACLDLLLILVAEPWIRRERENGPFAEPSKGK